MKIIKETDRRLIQITGYRGVCDGCGTPLEYPGELVLVVIDENDRRLLGVPVDILACPYCNKTLATMNLYDLNVSTNQEKNR